MKVRKKPVVVEAHRWEKNGDFPGDHVGDMRKDSMGNEFERLEGEVVRFYRHPDLNGKQKHCDISDARPNCEAIMHVHGWIDTIEGGHTVCPGDYIITGVKGERYPVEPSIFFATYDIIDGDD